MSGLSEVIELTDLRGRIDRAIETRLTHTAADLSELRPESDDLLDTIGVLLRGGKRLRALFLYLGLRAGGEPDSDAAVTLAASMEFLQAAALIHDDVIDDSATRRGHPTTHVALAATHQDRAWEGSADRFGLAGAILAGNLCLGWADQTYDECGLPATLLARGRATFDRMRAQLMAGQYLDVVESVRPWSLLPADERIARAERVITYKSAKYSIQHPLLIGADIAALDGGNREALARYGLDLGIAFQLRDDLLGVFGDSASTGKPVGDDLREGKRTVLIAHTLAAVDAAHAAKLEAGLGRGDLTDAQVSGLAGLIAGSGAVDRVEERITDLAESALDALDAADIDVAAKAALAELVTETTARTA